MTGVSKKAVMRLMVEAGNAAADYQDRAFPKSKNAAVSKLMNYGASVYCKEKNVTDTIASKNAAAGDVWLWVAIQTDAKLVPSFMLGNARRSVFEALH